MTSYAGTGTALEAAQVPPGEHEEEITEPVTVALLASLEPSEFRARGCRAVTFAQPVSFGADAEFDIRFIRFIREALSSLLTVGWSLATPGPADVSVLSHLSPPHLPPPTAGKATGDAAGQDAAQYARQWRADYGFAHCYYRLGPEFVHIVDVRDTADAARFLLDEPAAVAAFLLLAGAVKLSSIPPLAAELAEQLAEAGLLLRIGGWATILPCRLARWPLPCTAV